MKALRLQYGVLYDLIEGNPELYFQGEVGQMLHAHNDSAGSHFKGQRAWNNRPLANLYYEAVEITKILPHVNCHQWQIYSGLDEDSIIGISWDISRGPVGDLGDLVKNIAAVRDQCRT